MNISFLQVWRADFYNRSRQTSYLVILLFMLLLTLFFFPVSDANYQTLEINGYRGIYNSAWMGATLATLQVVFLPIICFYLIKNSVERDRKLTMSDLIAATPISKTSYLAGKWLSNLSLLLGIALVMLVTTVFVQLWIGEDYQIQLLPFLLPQLIFVLPVLAVIAGFALLFEMFIWLRGGFGNIAYFFLWIGIIVHSVEGHSGIGQVMQQMEAAVVQFDPASVDRQSQVGIKIAAENTPLKLFVWQGLDYTSTLWLAMAVILGIALCIFLLTPLFFDRFAKPIAHKNLSATQRARFKPLLKFGQKLSQKISRVSEISPQLRLIYLECLLMLRGKPALFYFALMGLLIAQLVADIEIVRTLLVPVSLLLCVLLISPLGQREIDQNTFMLVFSCPSPNHQQLKPMMIAGFLILFICTSGAFVRYVFTQDFSAIATLFVGLLFTITLAICCATLTRTSRTFEVLYTLLWYIGPMQQQSYLDFLGADTGFTHSHALTFYYLVIAILLMFLAGLGRKAQMLKS